MPRVTTKHVIATSGTSPSFAMFGGSGFGLPERRLRRDHRRRLPARRRRYRRHRADDGLGCPWRVQPQLGSVLVVQPVRQLLGGSVRRRRERQSAGCGNHSAKGAYCAAFAASHPGQALAGNAAGNYTCNPDFNVSQLGVVTRWTPVKNLTFSAEVQWFHLDQKMSGCSVFTATAPKPTALYEFKDQDTVLLQVRVQRNF